MEGVEVECVQGVCCCTMGMELYGGWDGEKGNVGLICELDWGGIESK